MEEQIREMRGVAKKVLDIISTDFVFSLFNTEEIEDISQSVVMFVSDMQRAMEEKEVIVQEDEKEWVFRTLDLLLVKIVIRPVGGDIKEMAMSYALLAKNWNQLADSQRINDTADALVNFINYHQSVVATTEVLKRLTDYAEKVTLNAPAAWEVSRHYLLSLREKMEKRNENEQ